MARKDNFDFDTEYKPKGSFRLSLDFLNNIRFLDRFTYSQKKLMFISLIIIVVAIVSTMIVWIVAANGGFNSAINGDIDIGGGTSQGGTEDGGDEGNNGGGGNSSIYGDIRDFYIDTEPNKTAYPVGSEPVYTGLRVRFSTDSFENGLVGSPCSPRDSQESSPTPQFKSINSSASESDK